MKHTVFKSNQCFFHTGRTTSTQKITVHPEKNVPFLNYRVTFKYLAGCQ